MTTFWIDITAYFLVSAIALTAGIHLYAVLLRVVATRFPTLMVPLGITLHLAYASLFFVSGLALQCLGTRGSPFSDVEREIGVVALLLSMGAAVSFFYQRHYQSLQQLGYFQPRR